jgi:hypothetical protein
MLRPEPGPGEVLVKVADGVGFDDFSARAAQGIEMRGQLGPAKSKDFDGASGGREALAPTTLGTTARISMVRDPDGNFIELSQRASLTGSLE